MRIPNSVKIGNYEYEVIQTEEPILHQGMQCLGLYDYENQTIHLAKDVTRQTLEHTFIHEVIHGIVEDRRLDFGDDLELVVDELAKGIQQLVRDNLGIFSTIK
ncbi:MAG: hypothetical protein ACRCX2_29155 [Paraclostridium sp.]